MVGIMTRLSDNLHPIGNSRAIEKGRYASADQINQSVISITAGAAWSISAWPNIEPSSGVPPLAKRQPAMNARKNIGCRFVEDSLWLTQALMAELFRGKVPSINEHLNTLFAEGETQPEATIRKFLRVCPWRMLPMLCRNQSSSKRRTTADRAVAVVRKLRLTSRKPTAARKSAIQSR